MIPEIRRQYNSQFTQEKYQNLLNSVNTGFGKASTFRIAETPIFIPNDLKAQLIDACDQLSNYLLTDDFKLNSAKSLSKLGFEVPNENNHTTFKINKKSK